LERVALAAIGGIPVNLRRANLACWITNPVTLDEVVYDSCLYTLQESDRAARSCALQDLLFLMSVGAARLLTQPCRWVAI
jgi:uncharacterized protein (DUF2062 family)